MYTSEHALRDRERERMTRSVNKVWISTRKGRAKCDSKSMNLAFSLQNIYIIIERTTPYARGSYYSNSAHCGVLRLNNAHIDTLIERKLKLAESYRDPQFG